MSLSSTSKAVCQIAICIAGIGLAVHGQPEQHLFNVYNGDKQVGNLSANYSMAKGDHIYAVQADVKTSLLLTIHVSVLCTLVFNADGVLTSTRYAQSATGGFDKIIETNAIPGGYKVWRDKRLQKELRGSIRFTANRLYFEEPVGLDKVYSEANAAVLPLKNIAPGVYELFTPDGKHTTYTYSGGRLMRLDGYTALGKVTFKRMENITKAK